jgi:multidrug efflux system outer membrane protein
MNLSLIFLNIRHAKHVLARAIVCSMLLFLPACAIPPLRPAAPGPLLPAPDGAASSENSAQLGIQEFFNDPTLTRLIEQAVVGNRELKILDEEVQVARSEILARQAAYLPFVTLGATSGMDRYSGYTLPGASLHDDPYVPGKFLNNPLPNTQLGLNLFWQLDIWRELRNARDAAARRYLAASERRNYFVTQLVAEIAENYYKLMALDKRIENLDRTIELQEASRKIAKAKMDVGKGTQLAVQRFQAEVRKNESEKLIVRQDIVETENRINFLLNRFPQPVERVSAGFFDLTIHTLNVGVPAQLLLYRRDIVRAERELEAAGLDVKVARAHFFPKLSITGDVGYQAFNPKYLFAPDAVIASAAGNLVAPLMNKKAIQAEFLSANARQLESVYNYQRVILNAFTEVINRMSKVQNYSNSIELKKEQLVALEASVKAANNLFMNARVEYIDVLLATRDLLEAKMILIDTKNQQLSAIVNAYQALGGGVILPIATPAPPLPDRRLHPLRSLWNTMSHANAGVIMHE